jgi:hypothetical protein
MKTFRALSPVARVTSLTLLVSLVCSSTSSGQQYLTGKVVGVAVDDRITLTVQHAQGEEKVDVMGDCATNRPKELKQAVSRLAQGKTVRIEVRGRNKNEHVQAGIVILPNGRLLLSELLVARLCSVPTF